MTRSPLQRVSAAVGPVTMPATRPAPGPDDEFVSELEHHLVASHAAMAAADRQTRPGTASRHRPSTRDRVSATV